MSSYLKFPDAQRDMREAYYHGAAGVVTSATAWLVAAFVTLLVGTTAGIVTLLLGGMFIFPLSVLLCKLMGRSGKHDKENPLGPLAIEGTVWMIMTIVVAIGVAMYRTDWFFPAMLLVIAGRYLTFSTLYGLRIYWAFGIALAIAAVALVLADAPVVSGAFTGAMVEYAFGIAIFVIAQNKSDRAAG